MSRNQNRKVVSLFEAHIRDIVSRRRDVKALKEQFEAAQSLLKGKEQEIIDELAPGCKALVLSAYEIALVTRERRYPSWKQHFVELAGSQAADKVLEQTEPTIIIDLTIKDRERK